MPFDQINPRLDDSRPSAFRGIPRYVQYTSPVSNSLNVPRNDASPATTLPLNIIALIIAHLDDISDIARVTRTCRLLYYMTLPQLYERVILHSYSEIRYVDGRPEGFGGGSPFTSALNGLVTKNHAALVKEFKVWGSWKEHGQDEYIKGRVPDGIMMLNILMRAVVDKMPKLESFSWELDCKPFKTLYQGLHARTTLTSLTLKFPSTRLPRPATLIPPMPNLRAFKVTDIDPLCCPDDFSLLLLQSKRLEDLRLHFSPRLRADAETSVTLDTFFGRCFQANYPIKLKHFGLQNFFGQNSSNSKVLFDTDICQSTSLINAFNDHSDDPRTVFVDSTWRYPPANVDNCITRVRLTSPSKVHLTFMQRNKKGMERIYFVNSRSEGTPAITPHNSNSDHTSPGRDTPTTASSTQEDLPLQQAPRRNTLPPLSQESLELGKDFFSTITRQHGPSLRHLLLHSGWALNVDEIGELFRYCPNLEQVGFAMGTTDNRVLKLLIPFMKDLRALRILPNDFLVNHLARNSHENRMWEIGRDLGRQQGVRIEYIGLGDVVYRRGPLVEDVGTDGTILPRADITMVPLEEVAHFEVWGLDCLSLDVDPIAPFDR